MLTDEKLKQDVSEYVDNFAKKRFPDPLPPDLDSLMREIYLDAFIDGAYYAEEQRDAAKPRIVTLEN